MEMSQNNALTHGKLQRCQTQRSDMPITVEIMQTYDLLKFAMQHDLTALLYFKFLLKTQHEVPFINTSEATKRPSDPTENSKCTNVTNHRISKLGRLVNHILCIIPQNQLFPLSPVLPLVYFFCFPCRYSENPKLPLCISSHCPFFKSVYMKTNLFPWER